MPNFSSPNHDGPRAQTLGVVIHSTRGGSASAQAEYDATVAWFDNPASQVSAHAVVGPNGQVARPVDPTLIAWHAREYNQHHLGIEMAQASLGDAISSDILDAAARVVAGWHQQFGFPLQWDQVNGLCEHWEIPPGVRDGKTDVKAPFDRADFLNRVLIATGQAAASGAAAALNVNELLTFPTWAQQRLQNGQDFRGASGEADFEAHLQRIGADAGDPFRYGWPAR